MKNHVLVSIRITVVLLILTCGIYPALVWVVGQLAFRDQANGSLLVRNGRVIGSSLIGQEFASDRFFHSRPSGVSTLGPTSKKLRDDIAARVARANGLPLARVQQLIHARTEGRFLGVFGEPRVNVLLLNLDLMSS